MNSRGPLAGGHVAIDAQQVVHFESREAGGQWCAVCGRPLQGRFSITFWGDRFCSTHIDLPRCYSCQRPVSRRLTGGAQRHVDGRIRCNRCGQSAVDDSVTAERLLVEVRAGIERDGFRVGRLATPVRLVDQVELARVCGDTGCQPNAVTRVRVQSLLGVAITGTVDEIAVLTGLPMEHFQAVIAHELGHVWLCAVNVFGLPGWLAEGVAELAADRWLRGRHTTEASFRLNLMERNPDPVYGTGYRAVRRAVGTYGLARVLKSIRTTRELPRW